LLGEGSTLRMRNCPGQTFIALPDGLEHPGPAQTRLSRVVNTTL
jgi:hypothetical protein